MAEVVSERLRRWRRCREWNGCKGSTKDRYCCCSARSQQLLVGRRLVCAEFGLHMPAAETMSYGEQVRSIRLMRSMRGPSLRTRRCSSPHNKLDVERIKNHLESGLPFICLGLTTIGSTRHQVIDYDCGGSTLHLRHHDNYRAFHLNIAEVQMFLVTNLKETGT